MILMCISGAAKVTVKGLLHHAHVRQFHNLLYKDTFKMLQIMVHNTLRHFTRAKTGSVWQKGNFFIEIKLKYR